MSRDALGAILRSGPAMVVTTLIALGAVAALGWKARDLVSAAEAHPAAVMSIEVEALRKDLADNRHALDAMNGKLDQFNTRLSWLEGATSGALPPRKQASEVP